MLNPRYGRIGMIVFPYFVLFEMLAPVVELSGYIIIPLSYALGMVNFLFFTLFWTIAVLLGVILSTASVILEELSFRKYPKTTDLLKLVAAGFLENFGYHQLTLWWRVKRILGLYQRQHCLGKDGQKRLH